MACEKFAKRTAKFARRETYGWGGLCKNSSHFSLVRMLVTLDTLNDADSCWDTNPDGKRCVINKLLKD
jgi:hypothetical protein